VSGITLDAGGLIALDRNDRRVIALVARAAERGIANHDTGDGSGTGDSQPGQAGAAFAAHSTARHGPDGPERTGCDGCRPVIGTNCDRGHR